MASGIEPSVRTGSVQSLNIEPTVSKGALPPSKFGRFSVSTLSSDHAKTHLERNSDSQPAALKALASYDVKSVKGQPLLRSQQQPGPISAKELKSLNKSLNRNLKDLKKNYKELKSSSANRKKKLNQQKTGLGGKEGKARQKANNAQVKVNNFEQLRHDVIRYKTAEEPQNNEITRKTEGNQDKKTLKAASSYHKKHTQLTQFETKVDQKLKKARKQLQSDEKSIKSAKKKDKKDIKQSKRDAKTQERKRRKAIHNKETTENRKQDKRRKINKKQESTSNSSRNSSIKKQQPSPTRIPEEKSKKVIAQRAFNNLQSLIKRISNKQQASRVRAQINNSPLITSTQKRQLLDILIQKQISFSPTPPRNSPN